MAFQNVIFNTFLLSEGVLVLKLNGFRTVSTVGGCGGLGRTVF